MRRTWMVVAAVVLSVGGLARYEYCMFKAQNARIGMQTAAITAVDGRMDLLERGVARALNGVDGLRQDVHAIAAVRADLSELTEDVDALGGRLTTALHRETDARTTAQDAAVAYDERIAARIRILEEKVASVKERIEELGTASSEVQVLHTALQSVTTDVTAMYSSLHRDPAEKVRAMIVPTVQVSCSNEIGSGVVVWSGPHPKSDVVRTYVLTAYHVVAASASEESDGTCDVLYDETGTWENPRRVVGRFVVGDQARDLALLRLDLDSPFPVVAKILPSYAEARLQVFTPVYALGCPLGYTPMPTWGELATKRKVLNGQNHWMISAPTIFGNSGCGIFTADTYELIGILSRVSAYNNFINVAVPHMGILVPVDTVRDWLEESGYGFIVGNEAAEVEERGAASVPTTAIRK